MKNFKQLLILWLLLPLFLLAACNRDEPVIPSTPQQVIFPDPDVGEIKGFFLLNEGNMGSNKASLDYFDYETGIYHRNIFAERNPGIVKELGDVGNDIQIHGERLYAVINCSHFIEVMDVNTAKHIGIVSIPNCRYIVFKGKYAYVSSYAGPVQIDPNARLGYVAKVDTETLQVVGECIVGYQPEEMVIAGDKLYVANSGGYRAPNYDRTVSVIDLNSFTEIKKIDVAINLHRLELDRYGNIWVSSHGDHDHIPSKTFVIDSRTDEVIDEFDLPNSNMTRSGDSLYVYSGGESYTTVQRTPEYAVIDTRTRKIVTRNYIKDGTEKDIRTPYGTAVNPETKEIFVTDARDYVTPGQLHCYSPEGIRKWSVTTGDIPAHIVFTTRKLRSLDGSFDPEPGPSAYVTRVLDYLPAVGQYVNVLPEYVTGDTQQTMNAKVLAAIGEGRRGVVSLGGWGGYVVVGFDHTIENVAGKCDFRVLGNAFAPLAEPGSGIPPGGGFEPGVIAVACDENQNGVPDEEEWYVIAGSSQKAPQGESWYAKAAAAGNDVNLYTDYQITYHRPAAEPASQTGWASYIRWEDNKGNAGYKMKNAFHAQPYFPLWIEADRLTFSGVRLPQNGIDESGAGSNFVLYPFRYGYSDNAPNADDRSAIDIDWAVDGEGRAVHLPGIDFVKVYTGVNQENGWIGECSTEFSGVEDLHLLGIDIDTRQ